MAPCVTTSKGVCTPNSATSPLYVTSGSTTPSGPLPTNTVNGQGVVAVTGTAVQLPSNALVNGIVIKALSTNAASIEIGSSGVTNTSNGTGNGYIINPGEAASYAIPNTNILYFNGTTNDIVTYEGN